MEGFTAAKVIAFFQTHSNLVHLYKLCKLLSKHILYTRQPRLRVQETIFELSCVSVSKRSLVQNFHMKMSWVCMKMNLWAEIIFTWMISHEDAFWHRGKRHLGNLPIVHFDRRATRLLAAQAKLNAGSHCWFPYDRCYVICQTRKTVFDHIPKHRGELRGLKPSNFELGNWSNTVLSVWYIFSIDTKTNEKKEK